uniref:Predicted protein n=1 Tax=Hordeum vulgare subsp. vulgare TaxID=112509 RepID=F2EEQ1_HORVV|nr:predicted protein [Hordeum vulgare subsp. vulgare]
MATMPSIVFFLIVFMLLSSAIATQAAGGSGPSKPKATSLMVEACKNASGESDDPDVTQELCLSTFQSDNRSAEAKDLPGLVLVSIDILKGRVTDADVKVKRMLQTSKKGTVAMYALSICEVQYENAVRTLNICQAMIKDHPAGHLQSMHLPRCVDAADYNAIECRINLENVPGVEPLLTDNERLHILFNLNLALVAPYNVGH